MDSKVIFKFLSIFLLLLILFSCGTSSNGIFEKRKHLKGWYFKKNKKFNSIDFHNEKSEKMKSRIFTKEDLKEPDLSLSIDRKKEIINENELVSEKSPKILQSDGLIVENGFSERQTQLSKDLSLVYKESILLLNNEKDNGRNLNENSIADENSLKEKQPSSDPTFFKTLLIVIAFGLLFLVFFMLGAILAYSSILLSVIIMIIGAFLCFSYIDFHIQRYKLNSKERNKWTFWRSLKRVVIFLSIAAVLILSITYLSSLTY